jgi:CCR4-NOT transcription complex subunit 4
LIAEDTSFSAEEQASFNVDALVNDAEPELEAPHSIPNTPLSGHFLSQPRRATPTIPPGFSAPAIPRAVLGESKSRPGSQAMSRTTSSTITPAVPVVPVTPIRASTPAKGKKARQSVETTPARTIAVKTQPETPTNPTGPSAALKTLTRSSVPKQSANDIAIQQKPPQKDEEKKSSSEALTKEQTNLKVNKKNADSPQKRPKREPKGELKENTSDPPATPVSTKRQPPGKLDIKAATQAQAIEQSPATISQQSDSQAKNIRLPGTSTTSVPASPATAATGSPIKRTVAPRTLRVVPTPKAEATPSPAPAHTPSLPTTSTIDRLRSRQASIASLNPPGTPMSETTFDTASVTSASISRANSPPPIGGKVGTAPVRSKTKSQAKKDRQERKRQIEEDMAIEESKSDVEVVQAPIIGRKKKTKKPATTPKAAPAVTKSQPASPKPIKLEDEYPNSPIAASKPAQSTVTSATATPDPEAVSEAKEKREHTAQSVMADLQRTGELLASTLEFFKPLSSSLTHTSRSTPAIDMSGPPDMKIHFSEADIELLVRKRPVRFDGHDGRPDSRTLITPNGKFFWGLSFDLEEKALQLERQIEELKGHARFHPRRQTTHLPSSLATSAHTVLPAIATALHEAGKKLGESNTQQMPRLETQQDIQHPPPPPQPLTPADAGTYLNQFVLPRTDNPPPNQPRPEMAAVGGPPGAGTACISVSVGRFAKAAQYVVEGGAVGSTEIDGIGLMTADLQGGVFVQGLEALVGAGLGLEGQGSVMSLDEAERAMQAAKREHDVLEKKLAGLMRKNKKAFGGVGVGKV